MDSVWHGGGHGTRTEPVCAATMRVERTLRGESSMLAFGWRSQFLRQLRIRNELVTPVYICLFRRFLIARSAFRSSRSLGRFAARFILIRSSNPAK